MKYDGYFERIVVQHKVDLVGWPLEVLKNPSRMTRPELKSLHQGLFATPPTIYFARLSQAEVDSLVEERELLAETVPHDTITPYVPKRSAPPIGSPNTSSATSAVAKTGTIAGVTPPTDTTASPTAARSVSSPSASISSSGGLAPAHASSQGATAGSAITATLLATGDVTTDTSSSPVAAISSSLPLAQPTTATSASVTATTTFSDSFANEDFNMGEPDPEDHQPDLRHASEQAEHPIGASTTAPILPTMPGASLNPSGTSPSGTTATSAETQVAAAKKPKKAKKAKTSANQNTAPPMAPTGDASPRPKKRKPSSRAVLAAANPMEDIDFGDE